MEIMIWLGIIIVGIIIEAASPQLVSIWFVVGSLGGLIAGLIGAPMWLQITLTIVISVVCLILTRPLSKKLLESKIVKTNADRYIGQEGVVTTEINPLTNAGRVTVGGSSWSAFCDDGSVIQTGKVVEVKDIQGVKLLVNLKN